VLDVERTNAFRKLSPGSAACHGGAYVARLSAVTHTSTPTATTRVLDHVPDVAVVRDPRQDEDEARDDDRQADGADSEARASDAISG
jgi:hypothetical protein